MPANTHDLARRFFAALSAGDLPDALLTDDMTVRTTTSGTQSKTRYQGGIRLLHSIFESGQTFVVDSLTCEDDRIAAEVHSHGVLRGGGPFENRFVFILRIRDGRIASVAEHFDPGPVRERIFPLLQAAMAKG